MADIDSNLILKYQRCETSPQEEAVLLDYLDESKEHRRRMDRANFLYCAAMLNGGRRHREKIRHRRLRNAIWMSVAAVAAFLVAGILWHVLHRPSAPSQQAVVVENSSASWTRITLPDGSHVHINDGSVITYPQQFDRFVTLEGEACFYVVSDPEVPFFVQINGVRIQVTGTIFNIRQEPDGRIETMLASGKVSLTDAEGHLLYQLRPGEKVSCDSDGTDIRSSEVDVWSALLDIYGSVTVPNVSLAELCSILGRIYGVKIKAVADDGSLLTFSFSQSMPIEEIVSRLETVSSRKFEIIQE